MGNVINVPKLSVKNLKTDEEQSYNLPQDVITLGRVNTCDIELPNKAISRRHAELVREGDEFYLVDLKSGNGTLLGGKKIKPKEKHLLRNNDLIQIEDYQIAFHYLDENLDAPVEEDTDTDIIEIKMIKKVLKALENESAPSLEVLNGANIGKKILFQDEQEEIVIGREKECELFIDDGTVSRQHAKLVKKWGGIVLTDLGSKNGTYVNHEKISEKVLRDGDKVMFGTVKCLYRNPGDVNIDAISKEISRKKREAALKEAEMLAEKKAEEDRQLKEVQDKELKEKEEAVKQTEVPPPSVQTPPTEASSAITTDQEKPKLSNLEKALIAVAVLIGTFGALLLLYLVF